MSFSLHNSFELLLQKDILLPGTDIKNTSPAFDKYGNGSFLFGCYCDIFRFRLFPSRGQDFKTRYPTTFEPGTQSIKGEFYNDIRVSTVSISAHVVWNLIMYQ